VERAELLEHPMRTAHGAVDRLVTGTQTPPHQRRPVLPKAFGVVEALLAPDEGDVVVLVVADEVVDQRMLSSTRPVSGWAIAAIDVQVSVA